MFRYIDNLVRGSIGLNSAVKLQRQREISADLVLFLHLVLEALGLKTAAAIYRAYDPATWGRFNRKGRYTPIPETQVLRIMSFTRHCHQLLSLFLRIVDRRGLLELLNKYGPNFTITTINDICDKLPRWSVSLDPVNKLMQTYDLADPSSQETDPVTPTSVQQVPLNYVEDDVADQITNEDMGAFYARLQAEVKAPSVPSERRKKIERALTNLDRTIRTEKEALLAELRRQYGANIDRTSIDGHQFLLRPTSSVAMWRPLRRDGSENKTRPHISIGSRNGPGFHITKGEDPVNHFYYGQTGAFRYGRRRAGKQYSGLDTIPRDVAALAEKATSFLGSRRRG